MKKINLIYNTTEVAVALFPFKEKLSSDISFLLNMDTLAISLSTIPSKKQLHNFAKFRFFNKLLSIRSYSILNSNEDYKSSLHYIKLKKEIEFILTHLNSFFNTCFNQETINLKIKNISIKQKSEIECSDIYNLGNIELINVFLI